MPNKNIVEAYHTRLESPLTDSEFNRLMDMIPDDVQKRVLEEEGWENQHGSLARKILLLQAMKEFGVNVAELFHSLKRMPSGKPYIEGGPHFSVANDGGVAVCVVSKTSVLGVDVERMKPINLSEYREMMTFQEWREIYSHMIPLQRFYEFWTIKESVVKADGEHKNIDIKEIYIQPDVAFCNAKYWYINPLELNYYGYLAYMVCSNPHAEIEYHQVNLAEVKL
ncbi:MAG: hypothetical protein Kow0075_06110 [Salibacteraceae bacterium]